MAQVLPAEHELRRVIGDGEGVPDAEVDGLDEAGLLDLYRSLVLLRTYDERSVVYHRQGRIGTYAIFWGHEAMQAGSVHALEDDDWIFPSYRESAIGLLRGMPAATVLQWWRGHPSGWWNPADYNVASDLRADRDACPARRRPRVGQAAARRARRRDRVLRRRRDLRGLLPRGRELRRRDAGARVLLCNNNGWAISTPVEEQTRAETLADKAAGYGMPGVRVDGYDVLAVYEATREAVERARAGDGPTFIEAVTYRAAPHATADDPTRCTSTRSASRRRVPPSAVGRFEALPPARRACSTTRRRSRSAARPPSSCARGIARPRPSRPETRR